MAIKTMKTKQLKTVFESGSMGVAAANVDEAAHVIKHVKILGKESVNGRDYSRVINATTAAKYEGASVYIGHVKNANESRSSNYGDRIGTIRNPVAESDGIYGDLHYNPKHPIAEAFVYDAKNAPTNLGLSHHADLIMSNAGSKNIVESIEKVHSVDLVNRPATNNGLFESENPMQPKTLKQILESVTKDSVTGEALTMRTVLEDMMAGDAAMGAMPVEAEVGASAEDQTKAAFRTMVMAAFDDDALDSKATAAKIKNILAAYDKVSGGGASGGDTKPAEPAKESVETPEQKVVRLERENEARRLATTEGVKLEDIDIKAVCALESADDRTAFVKRLPKVVVESKGAAPAKPAKSGSVTTLESADSPPAFKSNEERLAFLRS